jgi:hypothetical protein
MARSFKQALTTNNGLTTSGYTGSIGYTGSAGSGGDIVGYSGSAGGAAIAGNLTVTGTGFLTIPIGTTAQRPATASNGAMRINSTTNYLEVYYNGSWSNVSAVGLGQSAASAAASATALQSAGINTNGNYWINIGGTPTEVYVDFNLAGGPYVLVMVAASTGTVYDYDSTVWTNTTGGVATALNPALDENQVSSAFYTLLTTRTGLALHNNSSSYFHYTDHTSGTPRALANGSSGVPTSTSPNGTTIAPNNIIPAASPARALGWWNAITDAGFAAQSNGATYYRYGYSHGTPDPTQFGWCRFGFTADLDSSDSRDRGIGIGIKNAGGGPVATFTASAGRWDYNDGTTGRKNNLRGFLYIKN